MTRIRTYSEVTQFPTFQERFDYLKLDGSPGQVTFGFERYLNQSFYTSSEWKQVRNAVIVRDNGCDLAVPGHEIHVDGLVHHINPMIPDDVISHAEWILDPEYLIFTTKSTHNAIHYGNTSLLPKVTTTRSAGDTQLWGNQKGQEHERSEC